MAAQPTAQLLIEALRNRGDARGTGRWAEGDPDYVTEYSLTSEHIPALISLATQWVDEPSENEAVYGPVHAWRALVRSSVSCSGIHSVGGSSDIRFRRRD